MCYSVITALNWRSMQQSVDEFVAMNQLMG